MAITGFGTTGATADSFRKRDPRPESGPLAGLDKIKDEEEDPKEKEPNTGESIPEGQKA